MDRPKHDLKGLGLHRDQIDLLSLARPKRRIRMDATLVKTGLLFGASVTLAALLSVARTALYTQSQVEVEPARAAVEKPSQTE